jgi:hypothetical protein
MTYGELGMQAVMPGFGAVMFTPSRRYVIFFLLLNAPVEFKTVLVVDFCGAGSRICLAQILI